MGELQKKLDEQSIDNIYSDIVELLEKERTGYNDNVQDILKN